VRFVAMRLPETMSTFTFSLPLTGSALSSCLALRMGQSRLYLQGLKKPGYCGFFKGRRESIMIITMDETLLENGWNVNGQIEG